MTLTIELTPEEEAALQEQATEAGLEANEYIKNLFEQALPMPSMTPAQAVEYWQQEGLIGSYGDPTIDSPTLAQQLRSTAWAGREENPDHGTTLQTMSDDTELTVSSVQRPST